MYRKIHKERLSGTEEASMIEEILAERLGLIGYELIEVVLRRKKISTHLACVKKAIQRATSYIKNEQIPLSYTIGELILYKKQLCQVLGISRPTLEKWIERGIITKSKKQSNKFEFYEINVVLVQLLNHDS